MIGNLAVGIQDFVIPAPLGDFESIATVVVGSSTATVSFTSIAADWQHLQLRLFPRAAVNNGILIKINSDTGSNYSRHRLSGNGSTVASVGSATQTISYLFNSMGVPSQSSTFGAGIVDFLDYANTNKYKTIRALSGYDANGSGGIEMNSTLWQSTSAITRIDLTMDGATTFQQYSHFALYGIKG